MLKDLKLSAPKTSISDLDKKLNWNCIKKMNENNFLDEDSQDNIHDLILFILFGVFIIFVLDTIYRFGKKSQN